MHRFFLVSLRLSTAIAVGVIFICAGCSKPKAPISITFRDAFFKDEGRVAEIHNMGDKHLIGYVYFENRSLRQRTSYELQLPPYQTKEFGGAFSWWMLKSNERIYVQIEGCEPEDLTVP